MVFVLTLKTWEEWDRPHHWYGRIHWSSEAGDFGVADSLALPDGDGFETIRHASQESISRLGMATKPAHSARDGRLVRGTWTLLGFDADSPSELLAVM